MSPRIPPFRQLARVPPLAGPVPSSHSGRARRRRKGPGPPGQVRPSQSSAEQRGRFAFSCSACDGRNRQVALSLRPLPCLPGFRGRPARKKTEIDDAGGLGRGRKLEMRDYFSWRKDVRRIGVARQHSRPSLKSKPAGALPGPRAMRLSARGGGDGAFAGSPSALAPQARLASLWE